MMPPVVGSLPNLLIIGAAKAGTTSLHAYLDRHPAVAMSPKKELQLFSRDDWEERLDWYRSHFLVRAPVRGESSPSYSMDPVLPHVPERAHALVPGARIVYLVRDPLERLLAHYVEFVAIMREKRSFEEAMLDFDSPSNVYSTTSRYAHQLERWREHYAGSRILVLDQRDLLTNRAEALGRVFRFLDVDDSFWAPEFDLLHNTRERKLLVNSRGLWLWRRGMYDAALRAARALPAGVESRALALIGEEIERPAPRSEMLGELKAILREDAERLREHTGQSFEHWSIWS
jgi:hypothetical protein